MQKTPVTTKNHALLLATALSTLVASGANAASGHSDDHGHGGKGHGAHVHGAAELTLALEGNDLELVLTSPAASIVGFEYKAESAAEREAVAAAEVQLNGVAAWLSFTGTSCKLTGADVDLSAVQALRQDEHNHGKEHGHEENAHHDEPHSDISAHYRYVCDDGAELESLRVGNDDLPFALEKIDAMWVTELTQGATVLTKGTQTIKLK